MRADVFDTLRTIVLDYAGIEIGQSKSALLRARLARRLRALGLTDENAYLEHLLEDRSGDELVHFIDAISTNFTSFFREAAHFEVLEQLVRERAKAGQRQVRVWCAAAATGEEPYSIAVTLDRVLGPAVDWKVLATDISTRALAVAVKGEYRSGGLPPELLGSAFEPSGLSPSGKPMARVAERLRERVRFARVNLAKPPFLMKGPFDAIFCRNVMIYFSKPVRQALVTELESLLSPGGVLCIGHTETLSGIRNGLSLERPSVYRKPEAP